MLAVEQWNVKLIINQNKIERLVNNEAALQFNNYETDNPSISNPTSLHGRFYIVHKKIRTLVDCSKNKSCTITSEMKLDANKYLRELDLYSDSFVDNVSALFLKRTFELEEFQNIETANMANSADAKSRAAD